MMTNRRGKRFPWLFFHLVCIFYAQSAFSTFFISVFLFALQEATEGGGWSQQKKENSIDQGGFFFGRNVLGESIVRGKNSANSRKETSIYHRFPKKKHASFCIYLRGKENISHFWRLTLYEGLSSKMIWIFFFPSHSGFERARGLNKGNKQIFPERILTATDLNFYFPLSALHVGNRTPKIFFSRFRPVPPLPHEWYHVRPTHKSSPKTYSKKDPFKKSKRGKPPFSRIFHLLRSAFLVQKKKKKYGAQQQNSWNCSKKQCSPLASSPCGK